MTDNQRLAEIEARANAAEALPENLAEVLLEKLRSAGDIDAFLAFWSQEDAISTSTQPAKDEALRQIVAFTRELSEDYTDLQEQVKELEEQLEKANAAFFQSAEEKP